jgi:sulfur-oxidizing protein SoxZ
VRDGITLVTVLMPHPMETGLRRTAGGEPIASHYITEVQVSVADRPVLSVHMGFAVSQDPLLSFRIRGGQAGDAIRVTWRDNLGGERTDLARLG